MRPNDERGAASEAQPYGQAQTKSAENTEVVQDFTRVGEQVGIVGPEEKIRKTRADDSGDGTAAGPAVDPAWNLRLGCQCRHFSRLRSDVFASVPRIAKTIRAF